MATRFLSLSLLCLFAGNALCDTVVFVHGEGGYPCIRIPAITSCQGALHAFAECRTRTGDGCYPTTAARATAMPGVVAGVCYKNSSNDGATWSSLVTLTSGGGTQPTVLCEGKTQSLLLQFNAKSGVQQMTSEDSGGHWSAPVGVNLGRYNTTSVGPGRGLQLSDQSPTPGRILFIGHHGAYQFDLVWYSDDNGKSYQLSESVLEKMDEAQLVEGAGGVVVANMRNNHLTSCKCRATAISKNGGMNFGDIAYDPTLISPVCMATIITSQNGSLLFANPASTSSRSHGIVRRSDDGGQTWPHSWAVAPGNTDFAYSCLTQVASLTEVGLLWETSGANCLGPSCQMVFSKYTVL